MKILQLCKKFPYPLKDGESVAVTFLAKALNALGCEVTLLAMNTSKHYFDLATLPKSFNHYKAIHTVDIDNKVKPVAALKALVKGDNYFLTRFESEEYANKIKALIEEEDFDIIQFETLQTLIYARTEILGESRAKLVLRSHNVEHEIWERIVENSKFGFKKGYLNHLTKQLKSFELTKINEVDSLVAITQRDMDFFKASGFTGLGHVTPIGLETTHYTPDWTSFDKKPSLSFIGSLDWMPNLEGVEWFLKNVMPTLNEIENGIELHLAGRNTPQHLLETKIPNVIVHGEVESSVDFINTHSMMIVPLFSGSGMRVKILEGLALGRVILTTSIGVEGIPAKDGEHLFIVDSAADFIEKITFCIDNPQQLKMIGENAKRFVNEHFDNLKIAEALKQHLEVLSRQ